MRITKNIIMSYLRPTTERLTANTIVNIRNSILEKTDDWDDYAGEYIVHCKDGDIAPAESA